MGIGPGAKRACQQFSSGPVSYTQLDVYKRQIWMPTNYVLVQAIEKFYRYYGPRLTVTAPVLGDRQITLGEAGALISERLVNIFRRGPDGRVPAFAATAPFQADPHWKDLLLFNEYFHGDTGLGLFMFVACGVVAALEHPASPLHLLAGPPLQRLSLIHI